MVLYRDRVPEWDANSAEHPTARPYSTIEWTVDDFGDIERAKDNGKY
jgi:hypothetical protein